MVQFPITNELVFVDSFSQSCLHDLDIRAGGRHINVSFKW